MDSDGLGVGVAVSIVDGSTVGVFVTTGVSILCSGSDEPPQLKKLQRINTLPTAPTSAFVLLRDLKLHGLNHAV